MKRGGYTTKASTKPSVKVFKPPKMLNLLTRRERRPISDRADLFRIHLNAAFRNNEPKKRDRVLMKFTLLGLGIQVMLEQPLKNLTGVINMGDFIRRKKSKYHQDIQKQSHLAYLSGRHSPRPEKPLEHWLSRKALPGIQNGQ